MKHIKISGDLETTFIDLDVEGKSANVITEELIDELHEEYGERFAVYLEDTENNVLRRDTVVIINGMNMVSKKGVKTKLSNGDLIVFMIAAVGG